MSEIDTLRHKLSDGAVTNPAAKVTMLRELAAVLRSSLGPQIAQDLEEIAGALELRIKRT